MKTVCLIMSVWLTPDGPTQVDTQKLFESLEECQAWKHQQEFVGPVGGAVSEFYYCSEFKGV